MDVLVILLASAIALAAMLGVGSMIAAVLQSVGRTLSGRSAVDDLADALHRERVLAHFERMRAAILAEDMAQLNALEDALLDLDAGAWANWRTQLREGAGDAGLRLDRAGRIIVE